MKRLLIIGASILQLPAIKKAKEMGLYVAVADFNPNAIGIQYADEYFNASTIDEQAICDVVKEFNPDGIMTLATDMPMRSLAKAASLLGLPAINYETAVKATDKHEMIRSFKENNVASPWFYLISSKSDLISNKGNFVYPCIMKPTDNAGSRGVVLVNSYEELLNAYNYSHNHSRSGNVIVEEYLQGDEVSVEVMVVDGVVHILAITDKLTTGAPHFVEMGHSQPSKHPIYIQDAIKELAVQAVKAVGIHTGPAHVEMMVTKSGPVMIELGARMGGDCITTHLVPLSTGIDMIKATIDLALGNIPDITPKKDMASAIRFIKGPVGVIKSIDGVEEAKKIEGVFEVTVTKGGGDTIEDIHSSTDRVGYVIAQAQSSKDAINLCNKSIELIIVKVE